MRRISTFFALTCGNALYRVDARGGQSWAKKLAVQRGDEFFVPSNGKFHGKKSVIAVMRWLQVYTSETGKRGKASGDIAALFLDEDLARENLRAHDKQPFDRRWRRFTNEVLRRIGNNHPAFPISLPDPTIPRLVPARTRQKAHA